MRKSKPAPLDTARPLTATEQEAVLYARMRIKHAGGLSPKHSLDYWRFSTKAELRGPVEADVERFLQGIKDAYKEDGEVSVHFLPETPGPKTWNEKLAAQLIADAKQGNADAEQVLREVAAEFLTKRIPLPNELADYVAAYLQQPKSSKKQSSHKLDYRNWILAFIVHDVARRFKLKHTRNEATEKHCGCSLVELATGLHKNTVQNAWDDYKGVADQRTPANYVWQARVSVTSSDGRPQRDWMARFPRVGSAEAMSRPSNRKAQRAQRAKAQRAKRVQI